MARKPRIHHTETDKAVMWDRWQKGESLEKIAQLFDRSHDSVARILRQTGGIRPPKRARSRQALSLAEREEISRGVVKGMDRSNIHQNRLNAVARRLNERPRETLNFETPAERFNQCVAATG